MNHFILFTGFLWTFNLLLPDPTKPPLTPTPTPHPHSHPYFSNLMFALPVTLLVYSFILYLFFFFFIIEQKHFTNVSNITLYFILKNTKIISKILPKLKENKRIFPSASMFYPVTVHIIFLVLVQFCF